jgi:hypothetical protein
MKKIEYHEGDCFGIPISSRGYALGIVARCSEESNICLGYFYNVNLPDKPLPGKIEDIIKQKEAFIAWFGDIAILNGKWPLIKIDRSFNKKLWPVPAFRRIDLLDSSVGFCIEYEQETPIFGNPIKETKVDADTLLDLPDERLYSAQSIEIRLAKMGS